MLDNSFLFLRGLGLGYERSFFQKFTFGAFAATAGTTTLFSGDQSLDVPFYKSSADFLGLRGRYFSSSSQSSSFYLVGGLVSVQAKTEAYYYATDGETKDSTAIGLTGGAGYQFLFKSLRSVLNLGLLYGPGYRYDVSATKISDNKTRVDSVQVEYSPFFEANIAFLF